MAVFKINKTDDYTVMSNTHLRDKNLSLKAKGLLSIMLSLPPSWDYSVKGLVAILPEGDAAVEAALKELKKQGYLVVKKLMPNETESGRIEYEYNIYEHPQKQDGEKQGVEKQPLEFQGVEKQGVENRPQLNTNKVSTNILNTDDSFTDDNTAATARTHEEEPEEEAEENENELKLIGGKLGRGVVMMTDAQFVHLCEILSKDEIDIYFERMANFIHSCEKKKGSPPNISHYREIIKWVKEDRKLQEI